MKQESKIRKFQPSMKMLLHSVFTGSDTAALSLYLVYNTHYNSKIGSTIIFKMHEYANVLISVASGFITCVNHRKLILTITNTDYVDRSLLSVGVPASFKSPIRLLRIQTLCMVTFILIPNSFILYLSIINNSPMRSILATLLYTLQRTTLLHSTCNHCTCISCS
jgi:hypothetical protein